MLPEHVSFGRRYVAIMSGLACASTAPAVANLVEQFQKTSAPYKWFLANTVLANALPSIRYFKLGTLP